MFEDHSESSIDPSFRIPIDSNVEDLDRRYLPIANASLSNSKAVEGMARLKSSVKPGDLAHATNLARLEPFIVVVRAQKCSVISN